MKILVIDDEQRIRRSLQKLLQDEGHTVQLCESAEDGLEVLKNKSMDLVMLDIRLPGMDGLEMLNRIVKMDQPPKIFMMSGHATLTQAVQATKLGAHNFFEKPLNVDHLLLSLRSIAEQLVLEKKVRSLECLVEEELIGEAKPMIQLKNLIAKTAPSEGRVLIFGENGSGKELVARAIHHNSLRKDQSFVSLNCAALPKDLVESELFGHEKGAFTGALQRKPGRFEIADGGTLFLDEIGDMSLDVQAKLLRVLQENEAIRVGGNTPYRFDVRIISATNKHLGDEIQAGSFREDLYFRLNVIPIEVPPLRERKSDIGLLANYFLKKVCEKTGKGMHRFDAGVLDLFKQYEWPGNVRELKNFVERLVIMSSGENISMDEAARMMPDYALQKKPDTTPIDLEKRSLREMMEAYERQILEKGFLQTEGNVSKLAQVLKTDRANLHRKLKSYGIK